MKFSGKRKLAEDHHPPQPEILRDDFGAESSSSFQEFLGDDRSMADVGNDDDFVDPFNDDVTGASEEGGGGSEAHNTVEPGGTPLAFLRLAWQKYGGPQDKAQLRIMVMLCPCDLFHGRGSGRAGTPGRGHTPSLVL